MWIGRLLHKNETILIMILALSRSVLIRKKNRIPTIQSIEIDKKFLKSRDKLQPTLVRSREERCVYNEKWEQKVMLRRATTYWGSTSGRLASKSACSTASPGRSSSRTSRLVLLALFSQIFGFHLNKECNIKLIHIQHTRFT